MSIRVCLISLWRDFAPWWDRYDSGFVVAILSLVGIGFGAFVEPLSVSGLDTAWTEFFRNNGLLALVSSMTAIVAVYRLRHRPNKTRPSVREDFDDIEEGETDFGLRNFGPGPALYVQAIVTVEPGGNGMESEDVTRFQVHDRPIHLMENEFTSLVRDTKEDWLNNMAEEYEITSRVSDNEEDQENPPMVNLYFSYVTQSGVREPTHTPNKRDDVDLLDELENPDSEARHIKLSRVFRECQSGS